MGGVEVVGQSSGVLDEDSPKGSGVCPLGGEPHGVGVGQYP
jgi:hypothetical protein